MNNIFNKINSILENKYKEKNKKFSKIDSYCFNLQNFKSCHLINNVDSLISFLDKNNINYYMFDEQSYSNDEIIMLKENKSVFFISYEFINKCIDEENRKNINFLDFETRLSYLKMALFQEVDIVIYGYKGNYKDFLSTINNKIDFNIKNSSMEMEKLYSDELSEHYKNTNTYFCPSSDYLLIGQNTSDLLSIKQYLNSYDNYFSY